MIYLSSNEAMLHQIAMVTILFIILDRIPATYISDVIQSQGSDFLIIIGGVSIQ